MSMSVRACREHLHRGHLDIYPPSAEAQCDLFNYLVVSKSHPLTVEYSIRLSMK